MTSIFYQFIICHVLLHLSLHLILISTLWVWYNHCHFQGEATEAYRGCYLPKCVSQDPFGCKSETQIHLAKEKKKKERNLLSPRVEVRFRHRWIQVLFQGKVSILQLFSQIPKTDYYLVPSGSFVQPCTRHCAQGMEQCNWQVLDGAKSAPRYNVNWE